MGAKAILKKILINPEKEKKKAKFKYKKNRVESLKILEATINALDSYGVKYYLDFGTLIGAMRDKGFIEWDDDMDISILDPKDRAVLPKVINLIQTKSKLKVTRATFARSIYNRIARAKTDKDIEVYVKKVPFAKQTNLRVVKVRNYKFNFLGKRKGNGRNCLDIFIKYPKKDKKTYWMAQNKVHSVDTALIGDKLIEIDFYHLKCKVPENYDEYLTSMYGDWKKPKEDWQYYEHDTCSVLASTDNIIEEKQKNILLPIEREVIIPANSLSAKITLGKDTLEQIPYIKENGKKFFIASIDSVDNPNVNIDIDNNRTLTKIANSIVKVSLLKSSHLEEENRKYNYKLIIPKPIDKDITVTLQLNNALCDNSTKEFLTKTVVISANNKSELFSLNKEEEEFISKYQRFELSIIKISSKYQGVIADTSNSSVVTIVPFPRKIALVANPIGDSIKNKYTYTLYLNKSLKEDALIQVNINDKLNKKIIIPAGNISKTFSLNEIEAFLISKNKNNIIEVKKANRNIKILSTNGKTILDKLPNNFFFQREETPLILDLSEIPTPVNSNICKYELKLNKQSESDTIIKLKIQMDEHDTYSLEKSLIIPAGESSKIFSLDLAEENISPKDGILYVSVTNITNESEANILTNPKQIITDINKKASISISQDLDVWKRNSHHSYIVELDKPCLEDTKVIIRIGSIA